MSSADIMDVDVCEIAVGTDVSADLFDGNRAGGRVDDEVAIGGHSHIELHAGDISVRALLKRMSEQFYARARVGLIYFHLVRLKRCGCENLRAGSDVDGDGAEVIGDGERGSGTNVESHLLAGLRDGRKGNEGERDCQGQLCAVIPRVHDVFGGPSGAEAPISNSATATAKVVALPNSVPHCPEREAILYSKAFC